MKVESKRTNLFDIVIKNGDVYDPRSGKFEIRDVGIVGSKIGEISKGLDGREIIDASNMIVSPGFIDIHMHEDYLEKGNINYEIAECMVKMGVTTQVGGNCGLGKTEIGEYIQYISENGAPNNYIGFVGHASIRERVGVSDVYAPTPKEKKSEILRLVHQSMKEGAIGISFGLEYTPKVTTSEMIEIGKVIKPFNGMISVHYRHDATGSLDSIRELIEVCRKSGVAVQISHIGSCSAFGYMDKSLKMISKARNQGIDVMADCYPYSAFCTYLGSTVFDDGCLERWGADFGDLEFAGGPLEGKRAKKDTFEEMRKEHPEILMIAHVMKEDEVIQAIRHPLVMIASDGILQDGSGHPRAAGTFPRILGRFVRENGLLTLHEALKKMTYLPAIRLGLKKKGLIEGGLDADITIFDPQKIIDKATYKNPTEPPEGIEWVIVNGKLAVRNGKRTSNMAGRPIANPRRRIK